MNPFSHTGLSISDSLKSVRKSVLIYETIIVCHNEIINNYPFIHSLQVNVDYGLGYANIYILD